MKDNPCIRIGHLKIIDHLILGIAGSPLKKNEINLNHSSIETIAMNSWDQLCDGLKEGNITGAFICAPMAMDLFASGLDIKILMFTHRAGSTMVKSKAQGINGINDFKGKTILVSSKLSIQHMLLHRLLTSAGLKLGAHDDSSADVASEVVNPFLMIEMLKNDMDGDIAGFAAAEPFGSQAVHEGIAEKICTSQSLWKNHPGCVFVLKASVIKHNHEAVKEIISLFAQTAHRIEDSKNNDIRIIAQDFLDQKKEVIHHVFSKTDTRFDPSLLIPDIDMLNTIQNYMADSMGVLKEKIDINHLVDNSFILNAVTEK